MAKIMLVEDDTNLSEIYQARLAAEGYQIVSAHDGEEALALAAKEKPDLIISDVMMPKISGFEMLDILRNTDGLKATKVIMLTALGQAEDKTRAEGLGADRYLVKSQVTLEDIVKAAQELLEAATPAPASVAAPTATATATPTPKAPSLPEPAAPQLQPTTTIPMTTPPVVAAATPIPVTAVASAPVAPVPTLPVTPPSTAGPADQTATAPMPTSSPVAQPAPFATPSTNLSSPPQQLAAATPVMPVDPNATADNKLVTDAVEGLLEGVASKPTMAPELQTAPTVAAQPSIPVATPKPSETTAAQPPEIAQTPVTPTNQSLEPSKKGESSENDNVTVAHKKIITPIDDPAFKKPDLNSLLAAEENKNPGTINQPVVTGDAAGQATAKLATPAPHQPGHIIAPDDTTTGLNSGGGIDPGSIAL